MLILFDQATPVPLKPYLVGHEIRTAAEQGWDRLKNGDLLNAAENAGFDLLLRPTGICRINRIWQVGGLR